MSSSFEYTYCGYTQVEPDPDVPDAPALGPFGAYVTGDGDCVACPPAGQSYIGVVVLLVLVTWVALKMLEYEVSRRTQETAGLPSVALGCGPLKALRLLDVFSENVVSIAFVSGNVVLQLFTGGSFLPLLSSCHWDLEQGVFGAEPIGMYILYVILLMGFIGAGIPVLAKMLANHPEPTPDDYFRFRWRTLIFFAPVNAALGVRILAVPWVAGEVSTAEAWMGVFPLLLGVVPLVYMAMVTSKTGASWAADKERVVQQLYKRPNTERCGTARQRSGFMYMRFHPGVGPWWHFALRLRTVVVACLLATVGWEDLWQPFAVAALNIYISVMIMRHKPFLTPGSLRGHSSARNWAPTVHTGVGDENAIVFSMLHLEVLVLVLTWVVPALSGEPPAYDIIDGDASVLMGVAFIVGCIAVAHGLNRAWDTAAATRFGAAVSASAGAGATDLTELEDGGVAATLSLGRDHQAPGELPSGVKHDDVPPAAPYGASPYGAAAPIPVAGHPVVPSAPPSYEIPPSSAAGAGATSGAAIGAGTGAGAGSGGPDKFCPSCGTRMAQSFAFCPSCGAKQPGAAHVGL